MKKAAILRLFCCLLEILLDKYTIDTVEYILCEKVVDIGDIAEKVNL